MKTPEAYSALLARQDCDCSKLRDNLWQPIVKFRYECEHCRVEVLREAMGEAAGDAWRRASKVPIHMIIGGRAWTEEQAVAAKMLQDVCDNIDHVGTLAIAREYPALALPASAKGGDDKKGDK